MNISFKSIREVIQGHDADISSKTACVTVSKSIFALINKFTLSFKLPTELNKEIA